MTKQKKNRKIMDKVVDRKIIDKKPSNLVKILKKKIYALCMQLKL